MLPPADAKAVANALRIVGHRVALLLRPCRHLLRHGRVVRLEGLAVPDIDGQFLQPRLKGHMIDLHVYVCRRDGNGGDARHAADVLRLQFDDVQGQRNRPADVLVVVRRDGVVEPEEPCIELVRVSPWEVLEPRAGGRRAVNEGLERLIVDVHEKVQIVARHRDRLALAATVEERKYVLGAGLPGDDPRRGSLPVLAQFVQFPVAVRICVLIDVGAQRHWREEGERLRVLRRLPDVLRHNIQGVVARREEGVEAGVRLRESKDDGIVVRLLYVCHVQVHLGGPGHAGVRLQHVHSVDNVVGRELHAVAKVHPLPKLDGHLGKVVVVDRWLGRQRVDPLARLLIQVPQSVKDQALPGRGGWTGHEHVVVVHHAVAEDLIHHIDLVTRHIDGDLRLYLWLRRLRGRTGRDGRYLAGGQHDGQGQQKGQNQSRSSAHC